VARGKVIGRKHNRLDEIPSLPLTVPTRVFGLHVLVLVVSLFVSLAIVIAGVDEVVWVRASWDLSMSSGNHRVAK